MFLSRVIMYRPFIASLHCNWILVVTNLCIDTEVMTLLRPYKQCIDLFQGIRVTVSKLLNLLLIIISLSPYNLSTYCICLPLGLWFQQTTVLSSDNKSCANFSYCDCGCCKQLVSCQRLSLLACSLDHIVFVVVRPISYLYYLTIM